MPLAWVMKTIRLAVWVLAMVALAACFTTCSRASAMVHTLGDSNFDAFVDELQEDALLLVDFYRPGCTQCRRLNPVLDFLEAEWEKEEPDASKRWFKLAKVDVQKNPRLMKVFGIQRVPDIRFVRAGKWGAYEGGRSIEDIQEFKERMALLPMRYVDGEQLTGLARGNKAVFVLSAEAGADPASVAPGVQLAATLSQHLATFCVTSREVLLSLGLGSDGGSPALVKVVTGPGGQGGLLQTAAFKKGDGGAGVASASSWAVSTWVEAENYGLVSELTAENFASLGSRGKLMVLGVFDPEHEDAPSFEQVFAEVASGFGVRHADMMIFGTVDRGRMAGFMESFDIHRGPPRVVVLDLPTDVFYTVESMRLEAAEITAFLVDVLTGDIPAQTPSSDSGRYVRKASLVLRQGGAWSLLLLIPVVGLLWVFCDTPAKEEAREALRRARRQEEAKEKEGAPRLKTD